MTELTWDVAADWDAAQSESRVVHENTGDYAGGSVQLGYPGALGSLSTGLVAHYPLHEDSGSTVVDASGNGRDGTYNGPTLGKTGLLNATAPDWDGTDDYADMPATSPFDLQEHTVALFIYPQTLPSNGNYATWATKRPPNASGVSSNWELMMNDSQSPNSVRYTLGNGSDANNVFSNDISTGSWYLIAGTWDGTEQAVWRNGNNKDDSAQPGYSSIANDATNAVHYLGCRQNQTNFMDTKMAHYMIWNRALSGSELQTLWDTLSSGSLTTGKKTS